MGESDEQLLARWRELLGLVRGYDAQTLDPVDRQTVNELRRQLTRTEEELDRRGLRHAEREQGSWQPLVMHEAPAAEVAPSVELTWEKEERLVPDWEILLLAERLDAQFTLSAQERSALPRGLVEAFDRRFAKVLLSTQAERPSTRFRHALFLPQIEDGFTAAQRVLIEVLATQSIDSNELIKRAQMPEDEATTALEQLRLRRPYPLLVEQSGVLSLSAHAREMVTVEAGRARVDGALFPNLLVNGVADPLSFPTFSLEGVVNAARARLVIGADRATVIDTLGPITPLPQRRMSLWRTPTKTGSTLMVVRSVPLRFPSSRLSYEFHFDDPRDALRSVRALEDGRRRGDFDQAVSWDVQDARLQVRVPNEDQALRVVQRLVHDFALISHWHLQLRVSQNGNVIFAPLPELLEAFLGRCRERLRSRMPVDLTSPTVRRERLRGLLRAADDERVLRLIDASATNEEARWALTHLGSSELTAHAGLGAHAFDAQPFSELQARAVLETTGLVKKRKQFALELEGVEAELREQPPAREDVALDRLVLAELERVLALPRAAPLPSAPRK